MRFQIKTIDEVQNKLLINLRGRVAMREDDIEKGIILGKTLLEKEDNNLDDFDFNAKKINKKIIKYLPILFIFIMLFRILLFSFFKLYISYI